MKSLAKPLISLQLFQTMDESNLLSYEELLLSIAQRCEGMSGASLAGVARAAASRALERSVSDFAATNDSDDGASISNCLVTQEDFSYAIDDVFESTKGGDGGEDDSNASNNSKEDK